MKSRSMLAAIALAMFAVQSANAAVNVQLNLRYDDPANEAAGGTWDLLAGSDGNGISGISVLIDDINNDAAAAGSTGYEVFQSQQVVSIIEIVTGSDLIPPLDTDIGLGPGTTGNVEDDLFPGNSPAIWANNALLASGTFGATRPSFLLVSGTLNAGVNTFSGNTAVSDVFGMLTVRGDGVDTDGLQLGDANRDGMVDGLDFAILAQNFGGTGGWNQGDFNSSGTVDQADLDLFRGIPEPTSLALGALAMIGFVGTRRRS